MKRWIGGKKMAIQYFEEERVFKLDTLNSSYIFCIIGEENFVAHLYYGRKLESHKLVYLMGMGEPADTPGPDGGERVNFIGTFPKEYPFHGLGDFGEDAIAVRTRSGHTAIQLGYTKHRIYEGKPELSGLPATFGGVKECTTLELICEDNILGLQVTMMYTVFEDTDAITRSVRVVNNGNEEVYLTRVLSASLDMVNRDFDLITVHGDWAREGQLNRYPLVCGNHGVASLCGKTGHQSQPFMALAEHNASQTFGEVYTMNFVYSGNFLAQVSMEQSGVLRAVMGIHPTDFCWKLETREEFHTPEVILTHTMNGIGEMTRNLHDLYRKHLIRGEYRNKKRPVLLNNWEATYFDFNTHKLLSIAREAANTGIEMLVVDDGWFGKRNDDTTSLGDWFVNEEKIQGGLNALVTEVNRLGLKFGIWMEPEMVSLDSNLYREHPDWVIAIPGRKPGLRRNQYVLDLSRPEVVDGVYQMISAVLHSANIEYVKWDMNRALTDLGSIGLPADRQGELLHRYVLGVYQLQERMIQEFPYLLLENCSSGGGRFDAGMLYYSPQIWTSDDTDAIERLSIQEGIAMIYPLSSLGAHVSDCPNHITGRTTPFSTRGYIALAGTFGYELDITRIKEQERKQIKEQVSMYHNYNDLIREGDYYRIASYAKNHTHDCYMVVAKDQTEALLTYIHVHLHPGEFVKTVHMKGLNPKMEYTVEKDKRTYTGEELMYGGYRLVTPWAGGDYYGQLLHIKCVE